MDEVGEAAVPEAAALASAATGAGGGVFRRREPGDGEAAGVDDVAGGPAPPGEAEAVDWDLVDPPSPEGFVDPQYDDEAYFN